jgi:hypothetical protein
MDQLVGLWGEFLPKLLPRIMRTDGVMLIDALSKEYDGCWSAIVQIE